VSARWLRKNTDAVVVEEIKEGRMKTVRGLFNGSTIELLEDSPIAERGYVLITFLEGPLEIAAARGRRLQRDVVRPPTTYRYSGDMYPRFTVGAIMTRDIITLASSDSVARASHLMREKGITSVVIEPDASGEWGIMTMRDVLTKIVGADRDPETMTVGEIASRPLIAVPPDSTLRDCSKLMVDKNIRRVMVKQADRYVGIISDTDIFQFVEERGWGHDEE
jgi:CBS domain-containing protein